MCFVQKGKQQQHSSIILNRGLGTDLVLAVELNQVRRSTNPMQISVARDAHDNLIAHTVPIVQAKG